MKPKNSYELALATDQTRQNREERAGVLTDGRTTATETGALNRTSYYVGVEVP
jgi:hypothetical protein